MENRADVIVEARRNVCRMVYDGRAAIRLSDLSDAIVRGTVLYNVYGYANRLNSLINVQK